MKLSILYTRTIHLCKALKKFVATIQFGRSLPSVPGFLLLSLVLFGLKQRAQGKLAAPIGLRSGIMTTNYLIQSSRVIMPKPETPFWMIGTYHLHPFDGVIGLSICSLLVIFFFPQKPVQKDTSV